MIQGSVVGLPSGPWLNVGSGPSDAEPWVSLDGSRQAVLSRLPSSAAAVASRVLGREVGRWPRRVRYCDVRRRLRFDDESVAIVYASHLLEHLYRDEARFFLREAHRVLKPGGLVRVVVPDVRAIVGWYLEHGRGPEQEKPGSDLLMEMLMLRPSEAPRRTFLHRLLADDAIHLHKWMYDAAGLTAIVREAGFGAAEPRAFLDSAIPRAPLSRVEIASRVCDGAGVCVEARK